MPFVSREDSTEFRIPGVVFTGLASPSRGATENAVWRTRLEPGATGTAHQLTREEIVVATSGRAHAVLDNCPHELVVGSAIIVPAHAVFSLSNPYAEPFEAIAVLPIGGEAQVGDAPPFTPPWAA